MINVNIQLLILNFKFVKFSTSVGCLIQSQIGGRQQPSDPDVSGWWVVPSPAGFPPGPC